MCKEAVYGYCGGSKNDFQKSFGGIVVGINVFSI